MTMAEPSSSSSRSAHGKTSHISKYVTRFLVIVCVVIFCMVEERAYYSGDFSRPVYLSSPSNYDILSDESFQVKRKQKSVENESSKGVLDNYENTDITKCREATVRGWPPTKSRNMSVYLKPDKNTTVIMPRSLESIRLQKITYDDVVYNKTHILIVCHSAMEGGQERRNAIRNTWMKDTEKLPVVVIFIVGKMADNHPNRSTLEEEFAIESKEYGDILQEDFIDSYFNLTLKSMFTLKWVNQLTSPLQPYNLTSNPNVTYKGYNITYLFKVDDDCYVNPEAILSYCRIMKRYPNAIVGHVLGAGSPAIRPHVICDNYNASTSRQYIDKWEVPTYMYPPEKFPNALSGSGYIMRTLVSKCLYEKGLEIPFVNLEDIFITGLAAQRCKDSGIVLRNSPRFHYMGTHLCLVKKYDILIHKVKETQDMKNVYDLMHNRLKCQVRDKNATYTSMLIRRKKTNTLALTLPSDKETP